VWYLRHEWDPALGVEYRLGLVHKWMSAFGGIELVLSSFQERQKGSGDIIRTHVHEEPEVRFSDAEFVSF
jgi:hypothetical protein